MAKFVCEIGATGCCEPGNPTRAENGQEAATVRGQRGLAEQGYDGPLISVCEVNGNTKVRVNAETWHYV